MSKRVPWYGTQRWRLKALVQLTNHPLCTLCQADGRVSAAVVADHIIPHKGDYNLFWHGELQSLCQDHHNITKKHIEERGYHSAVDVYGAPIDPNHPSNQTKYQ